MIRIKEIDIKSIDPDIFLVACNASLSYDNIAKLSVDHIQKEDDDSNWFKRDRTKTSIMCRVSRLNVPKEILKRKKYSVCKNKGLILPVLTNKRMNSYLKELADICHIKKNLTMHVAKYSFATSVTLNNGISIETVSKILGHTSTKTTQIYAKIVDEKISDDMKMLKAIL